MVPIPDVAVDRITQSEAARHAEFERDIQNDVGRIVPITLALKRETVGRQSAMGPHHGRRADRTLFANAAGFARPNARAIGIRARSTHRR